MAVVNIPHQDLITVPSEWISAQYQTYCHYESLPTS